MTRCLALMLLATWALGSDDGGRRAEFQQSWRTPAAPIRLDELPAAALKTLDGKLLNFRVHLSSISDSVRGHTVYECLCDDDIHCTLWILGDAEPDEAEPHFVRARAQLVQHAATVIDGTTFEGFTELRLIEKADIAGPR